VDGIIQDSQIAYESGLKYGANNDPELNKIIEIGIDFKCFNKNVTRGIIRKRFNLENRQIIFHSRDIIEIYNVDIVLKSLLKVRKEFPNCVYILTTTMEKFNIELKKFVIRNDLENNLLLVGYQNRIEYLKYFYRDADVNISIPSSDSSPFSVYESMACMTPNIVTDLPWVYSKFTPGKHLITCPIRDAEKLADEILEVLGGHHKLDLDSAYKIVYEKINLESENKKLEHLYLNLVRKKDKLTTK
jgi:glycosyltransferase involved in cell wall biosynthesis